MADQPRVDAWEAGSRLRDEQRSPPPGTVARGHLEVDTHFFQGKQNGQPATSFPLSVDEGLLRRGCERFNIYCTPCHGFSGDANGSVVERGFPSPPSYHSERLRNAPPGHLFDVISHGIGRMPRFSDRIEPRDRWAIAAYIRALQLSQKVELDELPDDERQEILKEIP